MGATAGLNSKVSCTFIDSNPYEYWALRLVAIKAVKGGAHFRVLLRMLRIVYLMCDSNTQCNL